MGVGTADKRRRRKTSERGDRDEEETNILIQGGRGRGGRGERGKGKQRELCSGWDCVQRRTHKLTGLGWGTQSTRRLSDPLGLELHTFS